MPPRIPKGELLFASQKPSPQTHCRSCLSRALSSTPRNSTKLRREMFSWLNGPGQNFKYPLPGSTNYLSAYDRRGNLLRAPEGSEQPKKAPNRDNPDDVALEAAANAEGEKKLEKEDKEDLRPFPLNQHFVSQSVLSEELRQEIWRRVKVEGKTVRAVSVELGVEMRRVGAVVRLAELENRIRAESQPLALPYAKAIHQMIPTTPYKPPPAPVIPHEPINDLPVHAATHPQLFYPTSESRAFNRVDAGRVFSGAPRLPDEQDVGQGGRPDKEPWQDTTVEIIGKKGHERHVLKAADARMPHPHLIAHQTDEQDPKLKGENRLRAQRYAQRLLDDDMARKERAEKKKERAERGQKRIDSSRWEFVVKEVKATRDGTGLDGRGTSSPGFRYGVPSQDRKRATIKIPTRVRV